jgi:RND family efflux transporter MFP subunit
MNSNLPQSPASPTFTAPDSPSKLRFAGGVAAFLIVVAAVAGLVPRWLHRKELGTLTRDLAVSVVAVVSPGPGPASEGLALPAEIKPLLDAPIFARANGYLKRYLVDIGAEVKEGELLAEIDTPELDQELAQARAQVAQAEAGVNLAKVTAVRWADLVKTTSVSQQEAAEKQSDLDLKNATLEAAKANVHRLEDLRSFGRVTAPFAGTITVRNVDVGQLVSATGNRELFRLAQTGTLRVYVRVPQMVARGIAPGQTAEVTIPELPGRVFSAKVVRTSGAMSADSRTLLTELELDNSKKEILAGSYAQVRFQESKSAPALTLPANTLLFRAEGPQVGIVDRNGQVELRKITLGRDFGSTVEILEGVTPADQVILNPSDSLVSGVVVRVTGAPNAPVAPGASAASH